MENNERVKIIGGFPHQRVRIGTVGIVVKKSELYVWVKFPDGDTSAFYPSDVEPISEGAAAAITVVNRARRTAALAVLKPLNWALGQLNKWGRGGR